MQSIPEPGTQGEAIAPPDKFALPTRTVYEKTKSNPLGLGPSEGSNVQRTWNPEKETAPGSGVKVKLHTLRVYADKGGHFRWHLKAPNGRKVASSGESFATHRNAARAAQGLLALLNVNVETDVEFIE